MIIQSRPPIASPPLRSCVKACPLDTVAAGTTPENAQMEKLRRLASSSEVADVLAGAACNVPEKVRSGPEAEQFDAMIRERIGQFQDRKGGATRLVHTQQLHGGKARIDWNPELEKHVNLFGSQPSEALVRISDASAEANPDGKSMYGFALELKGPSGDPTDLLFTGGTPRTEASQARDPEAQLALFNMLNPTSKLGGIANILWKVGPLAGPKMLLDVGKMRTDLDSLSDLTAWSRAPFGLQGKDGKQYVVKMRVAPTTPGEVSPGPQGETSSERLTRQFATQLRAGDARWNLEFQFMRPGENADDPRETWGGPWVKAGEVTLPRVTDEAAAARAAEEAEATKFNPWKSKEPTSRSRDKFVLRPWGEMNRARLVAYQASASYRG